MGGCARRFIVNDPYLIMKIVVTGTRGIPNIMGGVETHCEELFPWVAQHGYDRYSDSL